MPISTIAKADFTPKRSEAAGHLARKAAITSDAFERLSNVNKARAFRIARVNSAKLVQRARDIVKKAIAEGTDYAEVRRALLKLFDTEGLPRPALHRLRTVFQQNVLNAYSLERTRTLKDPDVIGAFPFWQYLTVGNGTPGVNGVRASHAALHGKVFRADNAFWKHYDPPWEYG